MRLPRYFMLWFGSRKSICSSRRTMSCIDPQATGAGEWERVSLRRRQLPCVQQLCLQSLTTTRSSWATAQTISSITAFASSFRLAHPIHPSSAASVPRRSLPPVTPLRSLPLPPPQTAVLPSALPPRPRCLCPTTPASQHTHTHTYINTHRDKIKAKSIGRHGERRGHLDLHQSISTKSRTQQNCAR